MRTPVPHRDGDIIRLPLPAPIDGGALDGEPVLSEASADESVPIIVAPPLPASTRQPPAHAAAAAATADAPPVAAPVAPVRAGSTFLPWLILGTCGGIAIGILASQLL